MNRAYRLCIAVANTYLELRLGCVLKLATRVWSSSCTLRARKDTTDDSGLVSLSSKNPNATSVTGKARSIPQSFVDLWLAMSGCPLTL
jgi:hypothetical protein